MNSDCWCEYVIRIDTLSDTTEIRYSKLSGVTTNSSELRQKNLCENWGYNGSEDKYDDDNVFQGFGTAQTRL
jgi:hypothetical protein